VRPAAPLDLNRWMPDQLNRLLVQANQMDAAEMLREAIRSAEAEEETKQPRDHGRLLALDDAPRSMELLVELLTLLESRNGDGDDLQVEGVRREVVVKYVDAICAQHDTYLAKALEDGDGEGYEHRPAFGANRPNGEVHLRKFQWGTHVLLSEKMDDIDERAEALLRMRAFQAEAAHGPDSEQTWWARARWMTVADEIGKLDVALPRARDHCEWAEHNLGAAHRTTIDAKIYLANLCEVEGRASEAVQLMENVFAVLRTSGRQAPTVETYPSRERGESFSKMLSRLGRHDEAARVLETMLADMDVALTAAQEAQVVTTSSTPPTPTATQDVQFTSLYIPPNPPSFEKLRASFLLRRAHVEMDLGEELSQAERFDEAEEAYRRVVDALSARRKESPGVNSVRSLHTRATLKLCALMQQADRPFADTIALFRAGLDSCRRSGAVFSSERGLHARAAHELAQEIIESHRQGTPTGSLAEAAGMLREALQLWVDCNDESKDESKLESLKLLARLLDHNDDAAELADVLQQMHELRTTLGIVEEEDDAEEEDEPPHDQQPFGGRGG